VHAGRNPNHRIAAVNDWYETPYPNGCNSSSNVDAHRCGSSARRIRQYSTNGSIRFRHQLNDGLRRIGGHIGYDVRPSARRCGHATAMLRAARPHVARLGIDPALVTCDDDKVGSRWVIEANGDVLHEHGDGILRYWLPTADAAIASTIRELA
jgi:predicted acetyltransferase